MLRRTWMMSAVGAGLAVGTRRVQAKPAKPPTTIAQVLARLPTLMSPQNVAAIAAASESELTLKGSPSLPAATWRCGRRPWPWRPRRQADRALRAGDRSAALASLDDHAARFPTGALAMERTALRLIVSCDLGVAQHDTVAAYLAAHPGSPLAARVRRACAAGSK